MSLPPRYVYLSVFADALGLPFRADLEAEGCEVVGFTAHRDHHRYTDHETASLLAAAREHDADLIGCSALLTTTMTGMKDVVSALCESDIRDRCRIIVGGAPLTQEFADAIGAGFIGLGAAPIWRHEDMDMMPKGRYRLMTDYMDRVGTMGKTMMYRTCTVQVNLDFASEADMVKKLRVALALQPLATALFANSPFFEGRPNGYLSWRSRIWRDLDPARLHDTLPGFHVTPRYLAHFDQVLADRAGRVSRGLAGPRRGGARLGPPA